MQLARFSPAEVLILQRTYQAPVRHMLRLTFADLILRDVLRLEHRPFQARPQEAPVDCYYVRPGEAAPTYQPRPHELPLLQVLPGSPQMVLLRHYVSMLLDHLPGPHRFRVLVTEAPALRGCIARNGWHKFFQWFALTDAGLALRAALHQETDGLSAQVANQAPPVTQGLPPLFGSALLVGAAPPPELHLFDQELLRVLRERQERGYVGGWDTGVEGGSQSGDDSPDGGDFGGGHSGGGGASGDFGGDGGSDGGGDGGCSSGCSGCGGGGD